VSDKKSIPVRIADIAEATNFSIPIVKTVVVEMHRNQGIEYFMIGTVMCVPHDAVQAVVDRLNEVHRPMWPPRTRHSQAQVVAGGEAPGADVAPEVVAKAKARVQAVPRPRPFREYPPAPPAPEAVVVKRGRGRPRKNVVGVR
jgi:hypothetical protein